MHTTTLPYSPQAGGFRAGIVALGMATLFAAGCTSLEPRTSAPAAAPDGAAACAAWYAALDEAIDAAGVRDASAYRIPGFAYLRADRFSASLREEAWAGGEAAFEAWTARLAALDQTARRYEVRNLPDAAIKQLGVRARDEIATHVARCGALLAKENLTGAAQREALLERARVPDDYAAWARDTGLYALMRIPFSVGVDGWHREAEEMFRKASSGEAHGTNLRRYEPARARVTAAQVREVLARATRDPLGVPRLEGRDLETLFDAYAPQYEIETTGAHDQFGPLVWRGASAPEVDTATPTVYRRLAYTRFDGRKLPQLVYTAWFPERPAERTPDLLAGKLDGVVLRVTLDTDGRPLVYDSIHPCGCYHMFFPTASVRPLPAPNPSEEWALIPATLPALDAAERVSVRIASRSHYIVGVRAADAARGEAYRFAEDDDLRALPTPDGHTRSVFGPDALVSGTERPERAFFWPMGIASPGTMRQWGRHPTAFIGRRHFDDADLVEKRFAPAARAVARVQP